MILTSTCIFNSPFSHIHNRYHRKRDTQKCFNQKEVTRRRDRETGLNTLKYKITRVHDMLIDGTQITVLNIELECDITQTPWCDCTGTAQAAAAEEQHHQQQPRQHTKQ